jgi:hypothetical protein
MNWQVINSVLETISVLFIIASVFYLAKQVKQGNKQSISDSLSDATKFWAQQYKDSFGTKKKAAFMRKALNDYSSLSQDEKACLFSIIMGYVGAWDNLNTKYQAGFLPEGPYVSITVAFASLLQTPGGLACVSQVNKGFGLPLYIMDKTVAKNILGVEVRPYIDCLDFLKINS